MSVRSKSKRYHWQVLSRLLAAIFGGYALTSAATVLLALIWPLPHAQALLASTMLSFILYSGVVLWVFAIQRLRTVWYGLLATTVLCSALSWLLLSGAVS